MTRIGLLYPYPSPISPQSWSGTPRGLADGFTQLGFEVVPIGARLPPAIRQAVAVLSRAGGKRGPIANRGPFASAARTIEVSRRIRQVGHIDALVAMDTEAFWLRRVLPKDVPVATYDDGTFALFARHPDSDISRDGIPAGELERWIARQSDGCQAATICCVSTSWAASSIINDYRVAPDRVRVVGMGHRPRGTVDPSFAEGRDWSTPRFLFVGVEWGRKNGQAVLTAFARLHADHPLAQLDVVGDHPTISQPGVVDHGLLRRDDPQAQLKLNELFRRATAFVLPSRFDPSPIAYLEAASAGLPVVATTEGGAGELLGSGAIVVHPADQEALLAAMRRLSDGVTAQLMGLQAQQRAANSTWSKVAERIAAGLGILERQDSGSQPAT